MYVSLSRFGAGPTLLQSLLVAASLDSMLLAVQSGHQAPCVQHDHAFFVKVPNSNAGQCFLGVLCSDLDTAADDSAYRMSRIEWLS